MSDPDDTATHLAREIQDQLRVLSDKFLERTRNQVVRLRELLQALGSGREPLTELEELAHKIHGSGAMFGFAPISECGGEIESLAENLLAAQAPVAATDLARLNELVERLQGAVQAALDSR